MAPAGHRQRRRWLRPGGGGTRRLRLCPGHVRRPRRLRSGPGGATGPAAGNGLAAVLPGPAPASPRPPGPLRPRELRAPSGSAGAAAPAMPVPGGGQRGGSRRWPGVRAWLPVLRWLPRYSPAWLQLDAMAGLSVGLAAVPQALAYAEVAGLPPQYGLYSSFMGCFVYCFLGTAKDVTLGPTAIMSLLVSSYAFHEPAYAILLAFLSGCIQLAMGFLRLGFLLDFVSCPVIKGFTSAASVTISFNQIKNILGLQGIPRQFFLQVYEILRRIGETSTQCPCSPVCWPGCLLLPDDGLPATHAHQQHPPGPPCLPAATLLRGCTQWHCPLLEHGGASQNGYRIDPNQELLAMGFANVLGSFVSAYPITGSFGRTAVNAQSGVCTPAGGLITGALVLLSLAYLTSLFYYIPKAALAAVIISAVVPMFDAGIFRTLWRVKRLDLVPLCVTFLLCFWEVQYGIVAGVLVSGVLLLYSIARPPVKVSKGDVLLVQPGSSLHFPAMECLRDAVCSHALAAASLPRSVILDCCHVSSIDYTVVVGLAELLQELRKHGLSLAFCSLQDPVLQVLLSADLEGFQHFLSREEAERCRGAEPGDGGAAPYTSTSESSLLPTGLIQ
ncbi:sodium-independent sulfate anion transporter isoform X3 [Falco biarmicus]|uniref:sodium-independent sulfate anion transporter isoform X3 n=1 Tax=Falco cherrug TaxID=345164 RepID=UPI00247ACFB7|nr:sodium-independent sulfate anion transporter isoform X3 [Falco cherrug]XP_056191126.1 sodium-independent sulfate anion transporter isoform X3 [Falco biarmicus]